MRLIRPSKIKPFSSVYIKNSTDCNTIDPAVVELKDEDDQHRHQRMIELEKRFHRIILPAVRNPISGPPTDEGYCGLEGKCLVSPPPAEKLGHTRD
jgi:hypothetical protein